MAVYHEPRHRLRYVTTVPLTLLTLASLVVAYQSQGTISSNGSGPSPTLFPLRSS